MTVHPPGFNAGTEYALKDGGEEVTRARRQKPNEAGGGRHRPAAAAAAATMLAKAKAMEEQAQAAMTEQGKVGGAPRRRGRRPSSRS